MTPATASGSQPGAAPLGVIELANKPLLFPGCVGNERSYPYPVIYETARDAYVSRIVSADPALGDAYCEAALLLERRGARAIIASCGFAAVYQQAVAARVGVPVLMSPLLLLPLLLNTLPAGRKLAVLTYDRRQLDERFLRAGGAEPPFDRIVVTGIEDSTSWRSLAAPQPQIELSQLREDVLAAVRRALGPAGSVGAILLECSAFCPFADEIRALTGAAVSDFHTAADLAMGMARGRGK